MRLRSGRMTLTRTPSRSTPVFDVSLTPADQVPENIMDSPNLINPGESDSDLLQTQSLNTLHVTQNTLLHTALQTNTEENRDYRTQIDSLLNDLNTERTLRENLEVRLAHRSAEEINISNELRQRERDLMNERYLREDSERRFLNERHLYEELEERFRALEAQLQSQESLQDFRQQTDVRRTEMILHLSRSNELLLAERAELLRTLQDREQRISELSRSTFVDPNLQTFRSNLDTTIRNSSLHNNRLDLGNQVEARQSIAEINLGYKLKPDSYDGTTPLREFLNQFKLIARANN